MKFGKTFASGLMLALMLAQNVAYAGIPHVAFAEETETVVTETVSEDSQEEVAEEDADESVEEVETEKNIEEKTEEETPIEEDQTTEEEVVTEETQTTTETEESTKEIVSEEEVNQTEEETPIEEDGAEEASSTEEHFVATQSFVAVANITDPYEGLPNTVTVDADQCELDEQNGWYAKYYNYTASHPDMELPNEVWGAYNGDPLSDTGNWEGDWYDNTYFKFSRIDTNLAFGPEFFPFDPSVSPVNVDGEALATNGHNHFFGVHWKSIVTPDSDGDYNFTVKSDDDVWVYLDGELILENDGVHPVTEMNGVMTLTTSGTHVVDVYFAERHTVQSHMYFDFTTQGVTVTPYSGEPCDNGEENMCLALVTPAGNDSALAIGESFENTEKTLETILDENGYGSVDVVADQTSYETWAIALDKSVTFEVKVLGKEAYYEDIFGIYEAGDLNTFKALGRTGNIPATTTAPLTIIGQSQVFTVEDGDHFGLAIKTYDPNATFIQAFATENTLNVDSQTDHAIVFEVADGYVVAFEDIPEGWVKDNDYNDLVLLITPISCADVPHENEGIDLDVSKTASVATTTPGTVFDYTITVTNNGPENASGVSVTDMLPVGVTFNSATSTIGSYATSTGIWTVGNLTASSTETLTINVTASSTGEISNTATATSTDGKTDNNTDNNSDTVVVTVGEDNGGGEQCVISNENLIKNGSFENPTVTHDKLWNIFDSGDYNWSAAWTTGVNIFEGFTKPEVAHIEIQKNGLFGVAYEGTQYAELDTDWDGPDGTIHGEPALVEMHQNIDTFAGSTYTLTYAYAGRPGTSVSAADNKMDVKVDGVLKQTHSIATTTPGNITWYTNSITFTATDDETKISFIGTGTQNSFGMFVDDVSVVIESCDNNGGEKGIDLAVSKTASVASTTASSTFSYTISVTNNGPETATGVEVTDVLPAGVTLDSATTTAGTYTASTSVWTLNTLAPSTSETMTLTVTVASTTTGDIVNTASATSTDGKTDNNTDNNSDTVTVTVTDGNGTGGGETGIDLAVSKTASISEVNEVDVEFTYTISVTNNGPDVAEGVEVTDVLPGSVLFVSASTTIGSYATSTGIWSVGDIAPNATETLMLTVKTVSVDADIVNVATGTTTTNQVDNNPDNNTGTNTVTIPDDNTGGGGGGGGETGGGSGGSSGGSGGGTINFVGTGSGTALQCEYLKEFLRYGYNNNPVEVIKLQAFLNSFENESLAVDGFFDLSTDAAVRRFQVKYFGDILEPWGHTDSTGYVYILTKKKVNEIFCNRAFPVTSGEAQEIVEFRAFLESLRARGVDTTEFEGGIGGNMGETETGTEIADDTSTSGIRDFFDNIFGNNDAEGDLENATTTGTSTSQFATTLRNLAAAALVFPGDTNDACGCLIVLIIILAIIYVLGSLIVNGMNENKPIEVVRSRKLVAFMIGVIIAIIVAFLAPYPCIIIPLLVILVLLFIWWILRRKKTKPAEMNKEFSL